MLIPDDVLSEILSHLPVKSLLKFRSVCKSWRRNIIDNPYFIRDLHLLRRYSSSSKNKYSPPVFVEIWRSFEGEEWRYKFISPDDEDDDDDGVPSLEIKSAVATGIPFCGIPLQLRILPILASCDGLLAVCCYKVDAGSWPSLHVVNPATRKIIHLPLDYYNLHVHATCPTCAHDRHRRSSTQISAAIMFDPNVQCYKLLLFWRRRYFYSGAHYDCCHNASGSAIFTLGAGKLMNSWRWLTSPLINNWVREPNYQYSYTTITNGAYHFCTESSIVAFDIQHESFKAIAKPSCSCNNNRDVHADLSSSRSWRHYITLGAMEGGLLYLFHLDPSVTNLEVWVLEDYAKGVWIKASVLDARILFPTRPKFDNYSSLVCISTINLGRPMVYFRKRHGCYWHSDKIYYYDPKDRRLGVKKLQHGSSEAALYCKKIWAYTPLPLSLISPLIQIDIGVEATSNPNPPNPADSRRNYHNINGGGKKIFVDGLPAGLTTYDFRRYFENYGKVTHVVVRYVRPHGFGFISFDGEDAVDGFITFDSEDAVDRVLQTPIFHKLKGKLVEVNRA